MTQTEGGSVVTFVGVVHPWMCDRMGHMNVRHYAGMFDDASFQLLGHVASQEEDFETGLGWADVRSQTEYRHEAKVGALLTIRSHFVRIGRTSLTFEQVMSGSRDGVVHAVNTTTTVRFDLTRRAAAELSGVMRDRATRLLIEPEKAG